MQNQPVKIDIDQVLKTRLPRHYRYLPRWVVRWLERTICQDRLNAILTDMTGKDGVSAADAALQDMGITMQSSGLEQLPDGHRYLFVSNHPLGGLDGLCLISLLGHHYNRNIKFLVNDLLMAVEPLRDIFLPINKFGGQSREAASLIDTALASDCQMITFPAGLCSRMQDDGTIADVEWRKAAVSQAINYQRDVVPIYFDARNSNFFYKLARRRKRLGIKFNIEMMYLPREMFKQCNSTLHAIVGEPIAWQSLDASKPRQEAQRLRDVVYSLGKQQHTF